MTTTIVYVSNAESGDIAVLAFNEGSGTLALLQRAEVGGMAMPMAISPDRRFLYVARRSDPLAVVSFGIDASDGRLTRLAEAPLPASMAYLATDRSGRFLLSASYPGSVIAVGPIGADGIAQPVRLVLPTAPNAHAIRADASNRFVFATALGGAQLMQFCFDSDSGNLRPNVPPSLETRPNAGPRHFEFAPDGRFVYLLNELDASLDVFALDADRGTLAQVQTVGTLPPGFDGGKPWAADLHLSPDGRFLYSSERRSSTLAAFSVDTGSGRLTPLGHCATQAQPRSFALDPSGRFVLVAGERSDRVGVHAIDARSGLPEAARHEIEVGRGPNWVEVVRLR